MRVSCALVVVVCLCVVLRVTSTRLIDRNRHGSCHYIATCRSGCSRTRRVDAMSSIRLLLLHPWVCLLCSSCLTPARPHASDCSRFIVAVLPAHVVISCEEHCGMAVLPALANKSFFVSSVALHVFGSWHLAQSSVRMIIQSPGCSGSLRQASACTRSLLLRLSQA